jgi:hypothetical protein
MLYEKIADIIGTYNLARTGLWWAFQLKAGSATFKSQ